MKRKRFLSGLLALLMLCSLLAGCSKEQSESPSEEKPSQTSAEEETKLQPKYAYRANYLPISGPDGTEIRYVRSLCMAGDRAYLAANCFAGMEPVVNEATGEPVVNEQGEPQTYEKYEMRLLSLDTATGKTSLLEGYTDMELPEGMQGNSDISAIAAAADGTLWVMRQTNTYSYDLPENFDEQSDEIWNYYVEGETICELLQLGADGALLQTSAPLDLDGNVYIDSFLMDSKGRFYLSDNQNIYLLDETGAAAGTITNENWAQLQKLGPDAIGILSYNYETDGSTVFKTIDFEKKAYGEEIPVVENAWELYPGFGEYQYLYGSSDSIYGVPEGAQTGEKLLSWLDCDVDSTYLENKTFLDDGRIAALESDYSREGNRYSLVLLEQVDPATLPQKQELTLACFGLNWNLRPMIVDFNRSQDEVRIVVKDYSEVMTTGGNMTAASGVDAYSSALQKLNTEILSGNVPDLLDTSSLPTERYAAKGLLKDLWPMIDADTELGRDKLMAHLFDTMSIDGKLYQITDTFSIQTAAVNGAIADGRTSWTLDEILDSMKSLDPNASIFGETATRSMVLSQCLGFNLDSFMDWSSGTCSFDSEEFISLLKFCATFPEEMDPNYDWETAESEYSRLQSGKQLMSEVYLSSFEDLQMQAAYHGGSVSFIGFPSENGKGSCFYPGTSLAISSTCRNTDAAWSFVRQLLLEEHQTSDHMWGFPTNANAFEKVKKEAMTAEYETDPETGEQVEVSHMGVGVGEDFMLDIYAMKQEEFDAFMELYENCSSVYSYDESILQLVQEESQAFFAGQKSAEETASLIQNRLSLYMAEQR